MSWLIEAGGKRILHLGDTMFHGWWWRITERFGAPNAVLAPINGARVSLPHRQPASPLAAAMDPEQAALAAELLQADQLVPIHYDGYALPGLYEPVPDALNRLQSTSNRVTRSNSERASRSSAANPRYASVNVDVVVFGAPPRRAETEHPAGIALALRTAPERTTAIATEQPRPNDAVASPDLSGRGSQQGGSLVAASGAEQKSADHSDKLLRFVQRDNANTGEPHARNPRQRISVGPSATDASFWGDSESGRGGPDR